VNNTTKHSDKRPVKQGPEEPHAEPNKIRNLTAYGGFLPVATMLEKLGFQQLREEVLTVKRATRSMSMYQFVLAMILGVRWLFPAVSSAIPRTATDAKELSQNK
jgi:hypothetical protein